MSSEMQEMPQEMSVTAEQAIKREIIKLAIANNAKLKWEGELTAENIDAAYSELNEDWALQDTESEFRDGQYETGLDCEWSRHYESRAVARQLSDGTWVGWTYWYGGGKHGEPEAMDWMQDAYFLAVKEEEKLVVVREFAKAPAQPQPPQ